MPFRALGALAALGLASSTALAEPLSIGEAIEVVNLVTAEVNRDTRTLQSGDKVHQDENIDVAADGSGELGLDDETKLALGPGSRMKLDKFVYDPNNKKGGSIVLNLVKGTFRFVTGIAAKPAYVIRTPVASITVRGTVFDLFIEDDGVVWALLHEGALQACNDRGQCQLLDEPGKLIRIGGDGDVGPKVKWTGLEGRDNTPFDTAFPFVSKQPSFAAASLARDVIILGNLDDGYKAPEPEYEPQKKPKQAQKPPKQPKYQQAQPRQPKRQRQARGNSNSNTGSNIAKGIGLGIGIGIGIGAFGRGRGGGGHGPKY